jgi:hypothetical protein
MSPGISQMPVTTTTPTRLRSPPASAASNVEGKEDRAHALAASHFQHEDAGDVLQPLRQVGEGEVGAGDELQDQDDRDDDGRRALVRPGQAAESDAQDGAARHVKACNEDQECLR